MAESCLICNRPLTEDQDCVTLTCLAREETKCHTTTLHDKCWEKKKKQLERQSTGKRIATTFFCLVDGCHNALKGQHTAARKVEGKVERQFKEEVEEGLMEEISLGARCTGGEPRES